MTPIKASVIEFIERLIATVNELNRVDECAIEIPVIKEIHRAMICANNCALSGMQNFINDYYNDRILRIQLKNWTFIMTSAQDDGTMFSVTFNKLTNELGKYIRDTILTQ